MSKPKNRQQLELIEKQDLGDGAKYEHWLLGSIDNEHHIHLPNGTMIIFTHEQSEGGVTIVKKV